MNRVSYLVRFSGLPEDDAVAALHELENAGRVTKSPMFDGNGYCVSLKLGGNPDEGTVDMVISSIKRVSARPDVFVSCVLDEETEIIEIPSNILSIVRNTDSSMSFSYTFVG